MSTIVPMIRGRSALVAAAAGLGTGLVARLLFEVLPEPWGALANTSALWGLVPFFVAPGVRARAGQGVALGILSLASMVAAWTLLSTAPVTLREVLMRVVVAVAAGAVCGIAGSLSSRAGAWPQLLGAAVIGGIVAGEALYGIRLIGGPQWWMELVVGLVLPIVLARRWSDRLIAVLGASVIAGMLIGAYLLYDAIAVG